MTSDQQEPNATVDTSGLIPQPRRTDPDIGLLLRHASRNLDPTTAPRLGNQQLHPTVYGGSRLLVRPTADEDAVLERLRTVAADFDPPLELEVSPVDELLRQLARDAGISPEDPQPLLLRVQLVPRAQDELVEPADAWQVLQRFRASYPTDAPERTAVQLDHVLTPHTDSIVSTPYWRVPSGYWRVPSGYWRVPSGN